MPATLLSHLRGMPAQFLPCPTPVHLRGLSAAHLPVNQLWRGFHSEANLEQAFVWLCEQNAEAHHHHDVWDYRRQWPERKANLRDLLLHREFAFQPVRIVEVRTEQGDVERREVRCAEDRLVIRALAQVLQPVLSARLSPHCTHLQGHGGVQQAVRDTQDYIAAHPDSFVIKSDVKGYDASIDHFILAEQLHALLPHEIEWHRLVWNFMRRTTEYGGDYTEVERGLPLGASLSPLLGAVYLSPLDALGTGVEDSFYRRYMDDWVWVVPKRHALRRVLKAQYAVLQALRVETHPDKTFLGKVAKGFDFLGFHCCPTGMWVSDAALSRRDEKLARLYEQGADKNRIALYLALWLGWAGAAGLWGTRRHVQP